MERDQRNQELQAYFALTSGEERVPLSYFHSQGLLEAIDGLRTKGDIIEEKGLDEEVYLTCPRKAKERAEKERNHYNGFNLDLEVERGK
jgi:hypothetical protein